MLPVYVVTGPSAADAAAATTAAAPAARRVLNANEPECVRPNQRCC